MVPASVLLGYQQRWVTDMTPVRVCEKSRRIGLTWGEAADDALYAAEASGDDTWYVGYNADQAKEFVRDVATWSQHFSLAASAIDDFTYEDRDEHGELVQEISASRVVYNSGHRVTALSSRPSNLRGKQGRVVIDEAAFHPDLPGLLKSALALLMWGGRVSIISTHNGEDNAFNTLVNDVRSGKRPYSLHRLPLDDALADGLYQRICLRLGQRWTPEAQTAWRTQLIAEYGEDADEELHCIPSSGGGGYLPRAVIRACMQDGIPVLRYSQPDSFATLDERDRAGTTLEWCEAQLAPLLAALPRHQRSYCGQDFGRSSDLSVLAPLLEQTDLTYRVPFLVELRNIPFEQQKQLVFYVLDRLPGFERGLWDKGGNGAYLAEVATQRYGVTRAVGVALSQPWYLDHMPKFKRGLEERALLLPQHSDVMLDLRALSMDKGVAKIPAGKHWTGSDGKPRHGDSAIALALAWTAAHSAGAPAAASTSTPVGNPYASTRRGRLRA